MLTVNFSALIFIRSKLTLPILPFSQFFFEHSIDQVNLWFLGFVSKIGKDFRIYTIYSEMDFTVFPLSVML